MGIVSYNVFSLLWIALLSCETTERMSLLSTCLMSIARVKMMEKVQASLKSTAVTNVCQ